MRTLVDHFGQCFKTGRVLVRVKSLLGISTVKTNIIANYLGQGWTALMGLVFIPLYIKYLGMEAYGLIGLFGVLQSWLCLLDLGLTPTLSREMARFTGGEHTAQSIRNLLRSVEVIGFAIAALTTLGIWAVSGWLASDWLKTERLPVDIVAQALAVMGAVMALRFIENIYRSSIVGLQQQVVLNLVTSVMATFRGAGAIGVLAWVSPTVTAFFIWQGFVSVATVALLAFTVYHFLPPAPARARFSLSVLRSVWHFAAGMLGITFSALLLTQVDKILLSRLLTLETFGHYVLAATVANSLSLLQGPVTQVLYPRFTELVACGEKEALIVAYHKGAQLVSVLMGSAAILLIFFGDIIMTLWTADPLLAHRVAPLLAVLALGTMLNGLMVVPYQMQLAYGWTSLAVWVNTIMVLLLVPTLFWVTPNYGAMGAAWVWVALNAGYVLFAVHFMYRRILTTEKWRWYLEDVALPLVATAVTGGVLRWVLPEDLGTLGRLISVLVAWVLGLGVASVAAPTVRGKIKVYLRR